MTDFVKHSKDKPRFSLIPLDTLQAVIRVLEHGAAKYGSDNWKKCKDPFEYYDACMRHIMKFVSGEKIDGGEKGSGESHLANAICCLMIWNELEGGE